MTNGNLKYTNTHNLTLKKNYQSEERKTYHLEAINNL